MDEFIYILPQDLWAIATIMLVSGLAIGFGAAGSYVEWSRTRKTKKASDALHGRHRSSRGTKHSIQLRTPGSDRKLKTNTRTVTGHEIASLHGETVR